MSKWFWFIVLPQLLLTSACEKSSPVFNDSTQLQRFKLPIELRETSGLAVLNTSELLAVGDETATVFRINLDTEQVQVLFSLGEPVITADFEGLAVAGKDVWLVTSKGMLYRVIDGLSGGQKPRFEVLRTRLKKRCEVEGLAYDNARFLLACKTNFQKQTRDQLMVYSWTPGDHRAEVFLAAPLANQGGFHRFEPSGLSIQDDILHVVAAGLKTRLAINRSGALVRAVSLVGHPQAEGIEIMPDGSIVIADEGKNRSARISPYSPASSANE